MASFSQSGRERLVSSGCSRLKVVGPFLENVVRKMVMCGYSGERDYGVRL